jgi:hypothetical protein
VNQRTSQREDAAIKDDAADADLFSIYAFTPVRFILSIFA